MSSTTPCWVFLFLRWHDGTHWFRNGLKERESFRQRRCASVDWRVPEYARFAATMKESGVPVDQIGAGDVLHFGSVSAAVLWPPPTRVEKAPSGNNDSIMLLVRYGEKSFLLTGDIEKQGETAVLREGIDIGTDLVKVAHHGSKTPSIEAFVGATHPSLAIDSVGPTRM